MPRTRTIRSAGDLKVELNHAIAPMHKSILLSGNWSINFELNLYFQGIMQELDFSLNNETLK